MNISNSLFSGGKITYKNEANETAVKKQVDTFWDATKLIIQRETLATKMLENRIDKQREQTSSMTLSQITQYLPFAFSVTYLLQPLPSLLCCKRFNIPFDKVGEVSKQLSQESIKTLAEQAVYNSIKFGSPDVMMAIQYIQTSKTFLDTFKIAFAALVANLFTALENVTKLASIFISKTSNANTDVKEILTDIKDYTDVMVNSLRPYGDFLLNYRIIKELGKKKYVDGKTFFFFYSFPQIQININNAMLEVYVVENNKYIYIPPQSFTRKYVKQLIKSQIMVDGVKVINQFNIQKDKFYQKDETSFAQYKKITGRK